MGYRAQLSKAKFGSYTPFCAKIEMVYVKNLSKKLKIKPFTLYTIEIYELKYK